MQQVWRMAAQMAENWRRRPAQGDSRALSGRLIAAQEEERRRIARELHDDVGQRLALLAIELDELTAQAPRKLAALAMCASEKVHALSTDIHLIARALHPSRLETLGLVAALRGFCQEIEKRHGVRIALRAAGWPRGLPLDLALALYRVAQEALQNAIKHSGARAIEVELEASRSTGTVTVRDTGKGFNSDALRGARGLGVAGMRERLRMVGGRLEIESRTGHGTCIRATVPLAAAPQESAIHATAPSPAG